MADYTRLPIVEEGPHRIDAVIRIPKDWGNTYEHGKQLRVFRLDCTLFSPVHTIPATMAKN